MPVRDVQAVYDRMLAYLDRNGAAALSSETGRTSPFWRSVLADRPTLLDLNDLLTFRRSDHTYGVGDGSQRDRAAVRDDFHRAVAMTRLSTPADYMNELDEPTFGAPNVFRDGDVLASPSFVVNALTSWQILEFLKQCGTAARPLRICEIGPGWGGCAYQLHQRVPVASYTLVDIADNLILSSIYLSVTLPGRRLETLDVRGSRLLSAAQDVVYAVLPAGIQRLPGGYDLIVNSFSLQEMDLESVDAYYRWIAQALAPDGIFVSLNAHGKAGVQDAGQYDVELFHWKRFQVFRKAPAGVFNTIPYAFVLGRRRPDSPVYPRFARSAVADLMQLGLDDDIQPLADATAAGAVDASGLEALSWVERVFHGETREKRETALSALLSDRDVAWARFLAGNWFFLQGAWTEAAAHIAAARAAGLTGFARVRAGVLLALADETRAEPDVPHEEIRLLAPHLTAAFTDLLARRDVAAMQEHLRRVFRFTPR